MKKIINLKYWKRKNTSQFLLICILICFNISINSIYLPNQYSLIQNEEDDSILRESIAYTITDWVWAENNYDWVSGNGTITDPYLIENHLFDSEGLSFCLRIVNLNAHVIIRNCIFLNSMGNSPDTRATLELINTENVLVENNCFKGEGFYRGIEIGGISNNNTILNNTITDFMNGIYLSDGASNNKILNNSVSNNVYGIELYRNSDSNIVSGNNVSWNAVGIYMSQYCIENCFSDNYISKNGDYGIYFFYHCLNNSIVNNTICFQDVSDSYDSNRGIYFYNDCNNNTISENNISYNKNHGIYLYSRCGDNKIFKNEIHHNSEGAGILIGSDNNNPIYDNYLYENYFGIEVSSFTSISGNLLQNNINSGIHVSGNNITVFNNTIIGGRMGLFFSSSFNATLKENKLINSTLQFYSVGLENFRTWNIDTSNKINNKSIYYHVDEMALSSSNFTDPGQLLLINCSNSMINNLSISNAYCGIYIYSCQNLEISNITATGNTIGLGLYSSKNIQISNNNLTANEDYGMVSSNCETLTVFNNNLFKNGISIGGSLDFLRTIKLNTSNEVNDKPIYFYMDAKGLDNSNLTNAGQILLFNCSEATISDINVSSGSIGIYMYSCFNNTIKNVITSNNSKNGITLYNSNKIIMDNITANNNGWYGIFAKDTNTTTIKNSKLYHNIYNGLQFYECYENDILYNNISFTSIGITMSYSSRFNISHNNLSYNENSGLYISYLCCDNNITDNQIHHNTDGVGTMVAYRNTFENNNISANSNYGMSIDGGNNVINSNNISNNKNGIFINIYETHEFITNNTVNENSENGIILGRGASYIDVKNNKIVNNGMCGILLKQNTRDNQLSNNNASLNSYGISLISNKNNNISFNLVSNNTIFGIYLNGSCSENTIDHNMLIHNLENGIVLDNYCNKNNLTGNIVSFNREQGISLLDHCNDNLLQNNSIKYNEKHGICLDFNCSANLLLKNNIENNIMNGIIIHNNCTKNNIAQNYIKNNSESGLYFESSNQNDMISQNLIEGNKYGIYMQGTNTLNTFTFNLIANNSITGVFIENDLNVHNEFSKNNFVNNTENAREEMSSGNNAWDSGTQGNFWDDYGGSDANGDGIGEDEYPLFGAINNFDRYPLVNRSHHMYIEANCTNIVLGDKINFYFSNVIPDLPSSVEWILGDGDTCSTMNATHEYLLVGTYSIELRLNFSDGSKDSIQELDFISVSTDLKPHVNFIASPKEIIAGQQVQFNFTGNEGNTPSLYYWDFGDGTNSTEHEPNHMYLAPGTYSIRLNLTDNDGDKNSTIKVGFITVLEDLLPLSSFTANATNIVVGDSIYFQFNGSIGNGNLEFNWDFGDPSSSQENDVIHRFTSSGEYLVKLTIIDLDGDESSYQILITVLELNDSETISSWPIEISCLFGITSLVIGGFTILNKRKTCTK
ncbi:MAG: right-handed parallel beta-helix repeat-containing protein [Candidatus Lokiarchaeota archaeon]|nr:right-handed parallel beta-helix repeat-containing protein [Candidatus Lokiarchaeota archaeon]